eukprot:TRINITY_DN51172_c0_g1_i1.p1 TRINITY_DN51172_c0_g1~~TRINITY_DN51172_c0_g1_i1.p1  ORF type:complete len:362 (-),score=60.83 TRINITY_DN51172_c0_g1_i1:70-1155(-)
MFILILGRCLLFFSVLPRNVHAARYGDLETSQLQSDTDLILIKTTASQKGYNHIKDFWASFLNGLGNSQIAVSIDVTPENAELNANHDWSSIPAMGNFIYTGTSDQKEVLEKHTSLKALVGRLSEAAPHALLHVCSEKDMLDSYPALREAVEKSKKFYPHPLGWGYNYASSLMLWKLLEAQGLQFDYVWEFQDDVRIASSQHLVDLISANKAKKDALLVPSQLDGSELRKEGWMWAEAGSAAFLSATSPHDLPSTEAENRMQTCHSVHTDVWATRTSRALMGKMHHWCAEEGKCAWTEQFPQTVAACEDLGLGQMARTDLLKGSGGGGGDGYAVLAPFQALFQFAFHSMGLQRLFQSRPAM